MSSRKEVKARILRLYKKGYRDEEIAKEVNLTKTQVARVRVSAGLEANTALTGILGHQVKTMLLEKKAIKLILETSKKEDCEDLKSLCASCNLRECVDCIEVVRSKIERMTAQNRKAV